MFSAPWFGFSLRLLLFSSFGGCLLTLGVSEEVEGPVFVLEPPHRVDFSNSTGTRLDCRARGVPPPRITWVAADGAHVSDVSKLRRVFVNGTIIFSPFRAEDYRQDVHANVYVCRATNLAGVIVSKDVHVRGVAKQYYELQVYDEFVIVENTGVLRCHIPSFVEDYVSVTSWVREDGLVHARNNNGGRFFLTATGDLYISNVVPRDSNSTYRCKTTHRLTGETRMSSPGRIIVTDPQSSVPPRVTHTKPIIQTREGTTVELPCAAQGYPTPSYRWLRVHGKDAVPLQMDSRIQQVLSLLVINGVRMEDSGTYRCLVFNSMGDERAEIALRVTSPLSVRLSPPRQTVDVGKEARLTCTINGFPATSVSWLKDGQVVTPDDRLQLPAREVLQIGRVQKEDRGLYQCMVSNGEEMAQASAEITLGHVSPVLRHSFPEKPVRPGSAVSFKCSSYGNPSPEISWFVDDNPLAPQPSFLTAAGEVVSILNISRVRLEDGGEYRCVATNPGGVQDHEGRLQVIGPPLVKPMKNISAVSGKPIKIKCRVTGHPLEPIVWEKDGNVLPTDHRQKIMENGTLIIDMVDRVSDQAQYTCIARNKQGLTSRNSLALSVKVPPTIGPFAFPPVLHEGMRARLQCVVTQGDLPIVLTWTKDGNKIGNDLRLTIRQDDTFSSTLTFPTISTEHSGNYMCIASNEAGMANYTAKLVVDVPPRWVTQPVDRAVVVKSELRLDCKAKGYPEPKITWKKAIGRSPENYVELNRTGNHYSILVNGSLHFSTVTETDEGYFLCHATNGIGLGLSKVVHVTVQAAAHFEEKYLNQTARRGDSVKLVCRATGDLPITISWRSSGSGRDLLPKGDPRFVIREESVSDGSISELTIMKADRRDSAIYSCFASNTFGRDEMYIRLTVLEPPEAPENVKIADHGSRSVKLLWSAPFDGSSPIAKYIIQYKNGSDEWAKSLPNVTVGGSETSAVIRGLLPGTAYSFRVIAANDLGLGQPSSGVGISTTEEAPAGFPRDIEVAPLSSDSLRVTCKPPLKSAWNGEIVGYAVTYRVPDSKEAPGVKTLEAASDLSGEVILDGLKKYTQYSIVVHAYNRMGRGPPAPEVLAFTAEDVPSSSPRNIQCSSLSSQSIQVSWEPPSPSDQNGIIQGYKVLYGPLDIMDDGDESGTSGVATTSGQQHTIFDLKKFTNYSIQILAFTRIGDGISSESIFCMTKEDVPSPPSNIKVLAMSSDAIHVTWKPPLHQNGAITKYNVYMRSLDEGNKQTTKHVISSSELRYYEVKGLAENKRYEFWVTASTRVGEGESTRVMSQKPTFRAGASIASFSDRVVISWQQNVSFECRSLGMPTPTTTWASKGVPIAETERTFLPEDGSLFIRQVKRQDAGNYSCKAENIYGKDEITYELVVLAPPLPPTLTVVWETSSSIGITWKRSGDGGSRIKGYILSYKQDYGKWQEVKLPTEDDKYAIDNLLCGTRYQLYITAFNKVGIGEPSATVTATTKGAAPQIPPQETVVTPNVTQISVRLTNWPDSGCTIQYFVVEYRARLQRDWTLVSNNLAPQHETVILPDLESKTWYYIRVTAHNEAGSTTAMFEVATLSFSGGTVGPGVLVHTNHRPKPFYKDVSIIVPIVVSTIFTLATISGICICLRRRKNSGYGIDRGSQEKKVVLDGGHPGYESSRTPSSLRKIHPPMSRELGHNIHVTQGAADDICPYATFRLPAVRGGPEENADSYQLQTFPISSDKSLYDPQHRCDFRRPLFES